MANTRIDPTYCAITANSNTPTCEDFRLLRLGSLRGTGGGHWFCSRKAIENGKCKLHHKRWERVITKWDRYTEN